MNVLLASSGSATANIVALVFVLGFTLYGFIRGFAKTFVSMFGTILSLLFAILLCGSVANFLQNKFSLVSNIAGKLGNVLTNIFGDTVMNTTLGNASEANLQDAGLSLIVINLIMTFKGDNTLPTDTTLNNIICPTFAYYIVLIISIVGLFIVFKLIFIVIGNIVKNMHDVSIVAKVDKSLGLALGLVSGIIYLEMIIMVIGAIPIGGIQNLYATIINSPIPKFFCAINPYDSILKLISFKDIAKFVSNFVA